MQLEALLFRCFNAWIEYTSCTKIAHFLDCFYQMKKNFLLSSVCFFLFLSNSFVSASTFEEKFGTITPVDTKFISKQIVLTCDEKFQKGEKRFQGFISSEYVWAYRNSGKFINLLFGYKTTSNGFRIEVLEKGLDGRSARYYNFHDKNSNKSQAILTGKVTGYKKKLNENWYSCSLNYLQANSQNKRKKSGEASIRELRRELYLLETFQSWQKKAANQLSEENHALNLYLDFQSHKKFLKEEIGKIEAASKEPKQANSSQKKVSNLEQIQQQKLDKLMAQNKLLSEKLSKLNSVRLSSEKELKKIRAENSSLKSEVSSLRSEKPKIKNQENYEPSVARLLMPETSHDYLDKFEKNTVGLNTTEQIVGLVDKIISLDTKNKKLREKQGALKNEIEASNLKISELEKSALAYRDALNEKITKENKSLAKSNTLNSELRKKINWETDCRVGANKIYPINVGRTRQREAKNRAFCLRMQHFHCSKNMGHVRLKTKNSDLGERAWKMGSDMDLNTYLVSSKPSHLRLENIKTLYWESIVAHRDAITELQKMGASCVGPLE